MAIKESEKPKNAQDEQGAKEKLINSDTRVVRLGCAKPCATIQWFTVFTSAIIAVQGIYLGYTIGVLTTIEKRFEIPSAWSGGLLSVYDVGHAITVLLVGHYGSRLHQPKWIAGGAFLSGIACFGLFLPHVIFGEYRSKAELAQNSTMDDGGHDALGLCQWKNVTESPKSESGSCAVSIESASNMHAYIILAIFQLVAGIGSSPLTTLTYVYIDDNSTRKQSPFYMGVASAMWAYGPALGFGLSSYTSQLWINLGPPPPGMTSGSPEWVGAWWLGLIVLFVLYTLVAIPFLFYPKTLQRRKLDLLRDDTGEVELMTLRDLNRANSYMSRKSEHSAKWCLTKLAEIPMEMVYLIRNPVFTTLSLSWVAGAYLFGGYSTFLPKYLEVVFYQPTFIANILGGIVAVMGVATSTAIGGKVLALLNPSASKALMFVVITFIHSLIIFILLMFVSCDNPSINSLMPDKIQSLIAANNFSTPTCAWDTTKWTNQTCTCSPVHYSPVCDGGSGQSYYSPCYLGCMSPKNESGGFEDCLCASMSGPVQSGLCDHSCSSKLTMYLIGSFISGTVSAFFQMALFTNLIWAVPKEKKANAVALSNFMMSVLGFIPSQILYGKLFDSSCAAWSVDQNSACESGYCLLYDNKMLRYRYHSVTAAFQFAALGFVLIGHFVSRNFPFPKHDEEEETEEKHETRELNDIRSDQ